MALRILFITGTDTGVGKTAVTAFLLAHLKCNGRSVRALKPFCSGERTDALLLHELQSRDCPLDVINPFYFPEALSPWSAGRRSGRKVSKQEALDAVASTTADLLLVEGAGGLLTPLGEGFNSADLISELSAEVVLVAPNWLGALNSSLLCLEALRTRGVHSVRLALVDHENTDISSKTNLADLRELASPTRVVSVPRLPAYRPDAEYIRAQTRFLTRCLDALTQGREL